jgi:hypothetical protein
MFVRLCNTVFTTRVLLKRNSVTYHTFTRNLITYQFVFLYLKYDSLTSNHSERGKYLVITEVKKQRYSFS